MAQCPATTSGRHHADHWESKTCFLRGRGLPSRNIALTFQKAALSHKQQSHRKRSCRTSAAASTMAEEMVAEPVTSERRQIQQMLNRCSFWSLFSAQAVLGKRVLLATDSVAPYMTYNVCHEFSFLSCMSAHSSIWLADVLLFGHYLSGKMLPAILS